MYIGSNTRVCLVEDETWDLLKPPVFRATGDLFTVKDKKYKYVGRKDNVVKRWGQRISLDAIEAIAAEHFDVTAGSCVLQRDMLALFVSLRQGLTGMDSIKDSLKKTLLKRVNKSSVPDVIIVLDELPLNRHGKTNKNKLKSMLIELKNHEISYESKLDLFKNLWKKHTFGDETEDTGFLSVGGNSVGAMLIVNSMSVEGFSLSMDVLSLMLSNGTLTECCQMIEAKQESPLPMIELQKDFKSDETGSESNLSDKSNIIYFKVKGAVNNFVEAVHSKVALRIAWSYSLGKCVDASPTCIVFRNGVRLAVVGSHSGRLAALNLGSGQLVWETQLPDRIESSIVPSFCGSQGIVGCYDGKMYCINLHSGHTMWHLKTGAMIKGTAIAMDDSWVIGSYDYHVYCVNTQAGNLKWKHKMDGIMLATPLYLQHHNLVVVASLAGQLAALDTSCGNASWIVSLPSPIFSSPCIVEDLVVVAEVDGCLHGIKALSGMEVWQYQVESKIFSSLVTIGDSVVFGGHDCSVRRVRTHREVSGSRQMWCHPTGSAVYATPSLLSPNHLITASTSGLVSLLDVTNGSMICSSQLPGQVFSSPVPCDSYIVVGCRDNHIYCFEAINES